MNFWDKYQDLKQSINGGVEPQDTITLSTPTMKFALGVYLLQTIMISLWWSIKDSAFFPWILFFSAFLQVGWFWNKVIDSWKISSGFYSQVNIDTESPREPVYAPTIQITTPATIVAQENVE